MAGTGGGSAGLLWLLVRVVLLVVGLLEGPDLATWYEDEASATSLILALSVFGAFGVLIVMVPTLVIHFTRRGRSEWRRPAWRERPIFGEPLQFSHAAAWYFVGAFAGGAFSALLLAGRSLMGPMMAGGLGIGLLAGTHLFVWLFPRAFRRGDAPGPR